MGDVLSIYSCQELATRPRDSRATVTYIDTSLFFRNDDRGCDSRPDQMPFCR